MTFDNIIYIFISLLGFCFLSFINPLFKYFDEIKQYNTAKTKPSLLNNHDFMLAIINTRLIVLFFIMVTIIYEMCSIIEHYIMTR